MPLAERDAASYRHAAHFARVAKTCDRVLKTGDQETGGRKLDLELDNVRAAIAWATEKREDGLVTEITGSVALYLRTRGLWGEAIERLRVGEAAARRSGHLNGLAILLSSKAGLLTERGDYPEALAAYEEALGLFSKPRQRRQRAAVLNNLAEVARRRGNFPQALRRYRHAARILRAIGNRESRRNLAAVFNNIGETYRMGRQYERAARWHRRSLTASEQVDDDGGVALSLSNLAATAQARGRYPESKVLAEKSLEIAKRLSDRQGEARAVSFLGHVLMKERRYPKAMTQYEVCLSTFWALGDRLNVAQSLVFVARAAARLGQIERAIRCFVLACSLLRFLGSADIAGPRAALRRLRTRIDPERFRRLVEGTSSVPFEQVVKASGETPIG